jgi:hypothetical protein
MTNVRLNAQKVALFFRSAFFLVFCFFVSTERNAIEEARATTPPSFEGVARRIAYAKRKYHSGWMCEGATRGFALEKFSTSPSFIGKFRTAHSIRIDAAVIPKISFVEKRGKNSVFSGFSLPPVGLEDPVVCRIAKCAIIRINVKRGTKKWREKNRVRVGCDTEKFPHIHFTIVGPITGTAEKMLVITVAPQRDICPHGRTYPRNAAIINISKIVVPVSHVLFFVWEDLKYMPRAMCANIRKNSSDAPFMCIERL